MPVFDVREALYTTRAMRRVRPDPIPLEVQARILDAAVRAPTGGNTQQWRFLLVDDPDVKARLGPVYRECIAQLWATVYADRIAAIEADPDDPENAQNAKVIRSAQHLADYFEDVPLFLFAFVRGDTSGGSSFPAVWSAMLAARAEGVGSSLTSVLVFRLQETLDILGVPPDKGWHMSCCASFGYPTGKWGVAPRRPAHEVAYRNSWGTPLGIEIPEPLWSPSSSDGDGA
jgi:nitroreductase